MTRISRTSRAVAIMTSALIAFGGNQVGAEPVDACLIGIGEDAEQDGILAFEVVRDLPGGGPDVLGDASHGGRLEALGGDECPCGVDNFTALGDMIDDQRHAPIIGYITTVV